MTSRKRMPAVVLGLTLIVLALAAMGFQQAPNPDFGDPLPGLTPDLLARFNAGVTEFENVEGLPDGLGPVFNDTACVNCHSQAATGGGSDTTEVRYGRVNNFGTFDPLTQYGGTLAHVKGIGLVTANGFTANFVGEIAPRPPANVVAKRRTTPLFGLGLVGAVPDDTLADLTQFEQSNTPLTAGRVNVVTDPPDNDQQRAGRFGWKCQHATLFAFAGDAYLNEMGITTPLFPNENCPQDPSRNRLINCDLLKANPATNNPNDTDNSSVQAFKDFMTFLAPPPRLASTPQSDAGAVIFSAIGCADCHTPSLQTGPHQVAALNQVTFFPFSDFLLHDMGSLGDGIEQSGAGQREMRTAPLWGVRVLTSFLHDGRAKSLSAAILAHRGQGQPARDQFASLSASDRAALIAFLKTL